MLSETITTRFWLIESLLIRLGADGDKETAGQRIYMAKDRLPPALFRQLMELNDVRAEFVHGARLADDDFAKRLDDAITDLNTVVSERAPLAGSMPVRPKGRVVIVDMVLSPSPAVRCTYLHLYNGSNQKLTMHDYRAEVWDIGIGALLLVHRFSALVGTFDPGEVMCLIVGKGADSFHRAADEEDFPANHWDIHATAARDAVARMNRASELLIQLLDESAHVVATLRIERKHM